MQKQNDRDTTIDEIHRTRERLAAKDLEEQYDEAVAVLKKVLGNAPEGKFLLLNFLGRWTQKCVLHLYIVHVCQDIKIFIFHDSYPYQDIHNGILTSLMLRPMMESGSEPSAQVT